MEASTEASKTSIPRFDGWSRATARAAKRMTSIPPFVSFAPGCVPAASRSIAPCSPAASTATGSSFHPRSLVTVRACFARSPRRASHALSMESVFAASAARSTAAAGACAGRSQRRGPPARPRAVSRRWCAPRACARVLRLEDHAHVVVRCGATGRPVRRVAEKARRARAMKPARSVAASRPGGVACCRLARRVSTPRSALARTPVSSTQERERSSRPPSRSQECVRRRPSTRPANRATLAVTWEWSAWRRAGSRAVRQTSVPAAPACGTASAHLATAVWAVDAGSRSPRAIRARMRRRPACPVRPASRADAHEGHVRENRALRPASEANAA